NMQRGDNRGIALAYGNMGIAYRLQGNLVESLKSTMWALKLDRNLLLIAEAKSESSAIIDYKNGIARHLQNIAIVYDEKGEYEVALEYYLEALNISTELGNKVSMAAVLGNIGLVFAEWGDNEQALAYYFKAVKIDKELGNTYNLCAWYSNIGLTYQALVMEDKSRVELYDTALAYYNKSLIMAEEMESKTFIAGGYSSIGGLYLDQGRYPEAIEYIEKSLEISTEIGLLMKSQTSQFFLSQVYARTNDFKNALKHFKLHTMLKDSLFSEDKSKEIGKLEAKHEFEASESERKRLVEEKEAKEVAEKTRSDNLQYSGILIFLVLLAAAVLGIGKLKVSVRLAEGIIFFSFLLLFEFSLVLLDPFIEQYSSGAPAIKLAFNAGLAAFIFPLHSFFEETLKKRLVR
ncbi:MAG: tetratricopeptide repeat protein, partial [Flavobacteriales bacterium]|nr:tetratricopeptide repeat protein [Flavobacteriales bacterium]